MTRAEKFAAYLVFMLPFGAYLLTTAPLITAGDAGELVSAAWLLGVPHPPGYPLFCMLGKLFSFAPFGNIAYRMNVMSAFFSAAGVLFIYLCALELIRRDGAGGTLAAALSASAALATAFTGTYWSQATYSEVYPIQTALTGASIFTALRAGNRQDFRYAPISCMFFGLSVVGHYAAVLFAPGLFVYLVLSFQGRWNVRRAAGCALAAAAGLTPFIYLYPRGAAGTAMSWGGTGSVENLVRHVTRASYGDVSGLLAGLLSPGHIWYKSTAVMVLVLLVLSVAAVAAAVKKWGMPGRAGLLAYGAGILTLAVMAVMAVKSLTPDKLGYVGELAASGGWPFLIGLSAVGAAYLYRSNRAALWLLGMALVVTFTVSVFRVPVGQGVSFQAFLEKFFIPTLIAAGMLSAAGLYGLAGLISRGAPAPSMPALVLGAASLALGLALCISNYAVRDQSGYYYAYDYSDNMLKGMEPDAVFMVEGDNVTSLMTYQKFVELKRPDVDVYEITEKIFPPFEVARPIYEEGKRPMYHSEAAEPDAFPGIHMSLSGLLSRFPVGPASNMDPWEYYVERNDETAISYPDYPTREIIANHYYFKGVHERELGRTADAAKSYQYALRAGFDMPWTHYLVGLRMRDELGMPEKALGLFAKASRLSPRFVNPLMESGRTLLMAGRPDEALKVLQKARGISPRTAETYCLLSETLEQLGRVRAANKMRRRCEELSSAVGAGGM